MPKSTALKSCLQTSKNVVLVSMDSFPPSQQPDGQCFSLPLFFSTNLDFVCAKVRCTASLKDVAESCLLDLSSTNLHY